jgi:hypothetical protein
MSAGEHGQRVNNDEESEQRRDTLLLRLLRSPPEPRAERERLRARSLRPSLGGFNVPGQVSKRVRKPAIDADRRWSV